MPVKQAAGSQRVAREGKVRAAAVWAFGQGLSQFSPALGLPDYATRWFLGAAILGFPFWPSRGLRVHADLYALRKQPDDMFEWLQRAWTQHAPNFGSGALLNNGLLSAPFVLAYQHDPRFGALCRHAGLPLAGSVQPTPAHTGTGVP